MKREELIGKARNLVRDVRHATLATLTPEGAPYASFARFAPAADLTPLFLFSRIAPHTRHLQADPRVSVLVLREVAELQQSERLTLSGTLLPAAGDDDIQRYLRFFPETREWLEQLDFEVYRLHITRLHYVGGFAAAHAIDPPDFLLPAGLPAARELAICQHMNDDHVDALLHYLRLHGAPQPAYGVDDLAMTGVDYDGFYLRAGQRHHFFAFPSPVQDAVGIREALVAMARTAISTGD